MATGQVCAMEVSLHEPPAVVSPSDHLTLWFCMSRDKVVQCLAKGVLPRSEGGYKNLLGLREEYEEALQRAEFVEGKGKVSKATHLLLQLVFTPEAVARYTLACAGVDFSFAPVLIKQVYPKGSKKDWKVWYFHADLPLVSHEIQVQAFEIT